MIIEPHLRRVGKQPIIDALAREANACIQGARELSLILFDLDHFKRINDFEGHLAGDAILAHVHAVVQKLVRSGDTFARIGGEEFALVLVGLGIEPARELAERIRQTVEESECHFEGRTLRITISCGVAEWTRDIEHPWRVFQQADEQLYQAKKAGRNQVR